MKALRSLIGVVIGLSLLAGLGAGAFILVRRGVELFKTLDAQTGLALGVASLVILLSALTMRGVTRWITKRDQALRLRGERATLYRQIIESWYHVFQTEDDFSPHTVGEPSADLSRIESILILHGSAAVITAYVRLRMVAHESGLRSTETRSAYARMVGAMRADPGSKPSEIAENETLPWLAMLPRREQAHFNRAADHREEIVPANTTGC